MKKAENTSTIFNISQYIRQLHLSDVFSIQNSSTAVPVPVISINELI
jgi:hypothetical protein